MIMNDISNKKSEHRPLADVIRPTNLEDIAGQEHLTDRGGILRNMLAGGLSGSIILWGDSGTGKTTIAKMIANYTDAHFEQISAVFSGVADMKRIFAESLIRKEKSVDTILFIDEIHRFSKSQQDALLPVTEDGTITLIGATTENPSFQLNSALLSRCTVLKMKPLDSNAIEKIIKRAEEYMQRQLPLNDEAKVALIEMADGDGRYAVNMIEQIFKSTKNDNKDNKLINLEQLKKIVQKRYANYDQSGEFHYNLISVLHKSVRASDPDSALYWFSRMIEGGENPEYIARRLVRMAAEDIGLADPNALTQAVSAWQAFERLGSPEGDLALAQAVVYLASSPKSNAVYKAYNSALDLAKKTGSTPPEMHSVNAPIKLMKEHGYSQGYIYDHDLPDAFSGQNHLPAKLGKRKFYDPPDRGFEREINKRLEYWDKLRKKKSEGS